MTTTIKDYRFFDVLDNPNEGDVAHLSHRGPRDEYGHWYTACGRIVPSYRAWSLAETGHDRVCASCHKKAR